MIDNTSDSVKLTFEQLQQIDATQKRLSNLESEIIIATKTLKGTKMECDRAVKEKLYQEELLVDLNGKIESTKNVLNELSLNVDKNNATLSETIKKIDTMNLRYLEKTDELNERERGIKMAENSLNKEIDYFAIKSSQLLEDQFSVKTAKDAFLKATETVTWK
jgi:chromosome segregation ATPase